MQISTQQFYTSNQRNFKALTTTADILQTQISTGKKLNAASDDPVGYRRLQGLIRDGSNDQAYAGNITIVQSALSQADTTLKSVTDNIQRAKELAVKANSGTLSASDRGIIADELDSILKSLVDLANTKDSRGASIFAAGDSPAVVDNGNGTFTFATSGPTAIPIGDSSSAAPGEAASRLFVDSGGGNILSDISTLSAALRGTGDPSAIAGSIGDKLTASNNQIAGVQGSLGARSQRVDIESTRITDAATDREVTRQSIEDVDVTQAITDLQKTMTILSAAQSSFSKLSGLSLFNYLK
ncbi:MAG: flagellar hook-associated protein FlgL [Sphingomonas sp.]|uniref:flagellar hook-associated protein FlgL n=1 Tax=Sphingomonas sp. TaxID=28214 RepID=UPI001AC03D80|nr:flagellar hook-associated protein FlgL [Sphingomonas sp.]MBN8816390.1 flagellar hook-associated protein FlgL [Sphingomonas sp.]